MSIPIDVADAVKEFANGAAEWLKKNPLRVFICGPRVPTTGELADPEPGATLREYVSARLQEQGFSVVWGEHRILLEAAGQPTVKRFNSAEKEIQFAQRIADCVIIFPASPGSYAELGSFCLDGNISGKLVVVFDKQHKKGGGFLVEAVAKAARARNAKILYRDYQRPQDILRAVRRRLDELHMAKLTESGHGR